MMKSGSGTRGPQRRAASGKPIAALLRFGQRALRQRRIAARRRRRALHHPVAEVHAQRVDGLRVRHRIGRQHAGAEVVARAGRRRSSAGRRPAGWCRSRRRRRRGWCWRCSSGARSSGSGRSALRVRADPLGRELQRPHLGRAEVLDDLRAGAASRCSGRGCRPPAGRAPGRDAAATTAALRCRPGRARARRRAAPSGSSARCAGRR